MTTTYYTQVSETDENTSAYITYVSGTDYSRVDIIGFNGGPYSKTVLSGMINIFDAVLGIMPEEVDNTNPGS